MRMRDERRKEIIEIWKTVIEVQQHFNDISMRIRGMFVTILLALFASIGFLIDKKLGLKFGTFRIQFAVLIPLFGIFGTWLFYFIDRYWYHRLLVGSVKHAIKIERKYKDYIPELSLSDAIGEESPYAPLGIMKLLARLFVRDNRFHKTGKLHSDGKIELFYKSVMVVLALTMIMLVVAGGVVYEGRPASSHPGSAISIVSLTPSVASTKLQGAASPAPPLMKPGISAQQKHH